MKVKLYYHNDKQWTDGALQDLIGQSFNTNKGIGKVLNAEHIDGDFILTLEVDDPSWESTLK